MSRHSRRKPTAVLAPTSLAAENNQLDQFFQRGLVFCFNLLVILTPFFFTWFNEELFEFNKMILTYGLTAVIVGFWLMRMVVQQKILFKQTWFDLPILFFLASQLLSTIFSMHPRTSWFGYYTRFHGGLLSSVTYTALLYALVSNFTAKQAKLLIVSILIAALGTTFYSIPEHFGFSPSCQFISGQFTTECWSKDTNPKDRIFGTFGQPNWLAAYVITLLPLAVTGTVWQVLRIQSAKRSLRSKVGVLYGAAAGGAITTLSLFLTLLYTKSRSGFIGMVVGGTLFAAGLLFLLLKTFVAKRDHQLTKPLVLTTGSLATLLIVIALAVGTPFTPNLSQALQSFSSSHTSSSSTLPSPTPPEINETSNPASTPANRLEIGGTDSGEIRKIVWKGAWDVWQRYPLLGSGVETFAYSYYLDRPVEHNNVSEWAFLYNKAHNEFLNFLATTGVVGLISYSVLLGVFIVIPVLPLIKDISRFQANSEASFEVKLLGVAVTSGLVALSISNFFGFSTVMVSILLFLLPALYWVIAEQKVMAEVIAEEKSNPNSVSKSKPSELHFGQLLALGGITVAILWALNNVYGWWRADNLYSTGKQYSQIGQVSQGALLITEAIGILPDEALFYDQLSQDYAQIAVALLQQGDATRAATAAQAAEAASQMALQLNPVHLNFYKSQARMYIVLGNLDPQFYQQAERVLEQATHLAPTDAKVWYNIALLQLSQGQIDKGKATLEKTISLRPKYEEARMSLAELLTEQGDWQAAADNYRFILESIAPGNTIATEQLELLEASLSARQQ